MNAGDVVLIPIPTFAGGPTKNRPALIVSLLPGPYQTLLLCGISSQLANFLSDWDELIDSPNSDYSKSGVHKPSIIRLSYLYACDRSEITGVIGSIDLDRLTRLQERLAAQISP